MSKDQLPPAVKAYLDNAMRLLDDAQLLRDNGRYSSAFVLVVISLEEIGKVVLEYWRRDGKTVTKKGRSAHIQKQAAVMCLAVAGEILPEYRAIAVQENMGAKLSELAFKGLSRRSFGTMIEVEKQVLDKAKQAGLYQDDDGSDAPRMRSFTVDEINNVVRDAHTALKSVPDKIALRLAHQFYEANVEILATAEG